MKPRQRRTSAWIIGLIYFASLGKGFASGIPGSSNVALNTSISISVNVEDLWTKDGMSDRTLADGTVETNLGNGIRRIHWPGGHFEILGLSRDGKPITYDLEGNNELWHYNLRQLAQDLELNAQGQNPIINGSFDLSRLGLGMVSYTQFVPGVNDNQKAILGLPDGRNIIVYSEHALGISQLENMAWVIAGSPRKTFTAGNASETFFVSDELGEVRALGASFTHLGGLHDTQSGTIFIRTNELNNYEATAFVLRHESGHDLDARCGWLSRSLVDKNGKLLFGKGSLVLDSHGHVNLKHSSFESAYAATNSNEDFAETHEFLLRFREMYNNANRGQDLFKLSVDELHHVFTKSGISDDLQEKMIAIIDHGYGTEPVAIKN